MRTRNLACGVYLSSTERVFSRYGIEFINDRQPQVSAYLKVDVLIMARPVLLYDNAIRQLEVGIQARKHPNVFPINHSRCRI